MQKYHILWADDEIDLLKPHILFLNNKGYEVTPVNSGADALEQVDEQNFDLVFLDENMPGMTGLETLAQIKSTRPHLPVVMITKSEEEHIMEDAIGQKIADYLIKPLNPNQILLSVKKILDNRRLVSEKTNMSYQQDFRTLSMAYQDRIDHEEWADIYKKLVYWELEIDNTETKSMREVIDMQKDDANNNFAKFIEDNYEDWLNDADADRPLLSHQLMKKKVFPLVKDKEPLFFVLIDNLRYDQWRVLQPIISEYFVTEEESHYYSILPTTTAYARNAIFSGMMPSDMAKYHSNLWVDDIDDEGKNNNEEEFLKIQLQKNKLSHLRTSYHKVITANQGKDVLDKLNNLMQNDLNVVVYNFVDMLSHARTDTNMVRELAPDESAYRSLTRSWFEHSSLLDFIRRLADKGARMVITTDHGTIRVKRPHKIVGDRNVNTNLRYKQGKNLGFDESNVFVARKPERFYLPKPNVSTAYVFAMQDYFFAYPNNYNYYVNYYRDTFQHGGVSLEEMIVPFVVLKAK
ncbi:Response regulator receiver domain-containing protein [Catalinimonas alkaloidigena]|uniref:Response regulator receiver domain-containing protein n=1 Tax=Catalinimonas alkaloidigena TaxID=1075417 RepID=A0A1G9N6Q8_9BACT|nr:PglZ domain-containing protein [Catalinimonas alkaloidigena]SDL82170.1 Response regulator receiver domain-containing protein [Catalinimonas alkaloidigena]